MNAIDEAFDLMLITVPKLELRSPLTAPALLKAWVEKNGFRCRTEDWNLELWRRCVVGWGHAWQMNDLTFNSPHLFYQFFDRELYKHLDLLADRVATTNPRWLGITLLAESSVLVSLEICRLLKQKAPHIKVVIGGPFVAFLPDDHEIFQFIDVSVRGDGETPLLEVLKGTPIAEIPGANGNSPIQIKKLDEFPFPDYSDFELETYPINSNDVTSRDAALLKNCGATALNITGSRGCVRDCTFCDIRSQWPIFRFRSGESIADEMAFQYSKTGISNFHFTDSLLNGSIKTLQQMCESLILAKKNGKLPDSLRWQSQMNCYSKEKMTPDTFSMMAEAGCGLVAIGIESGSEKVRKHMGKEFSNDDLEYTLEQLGKNGLVLGCLMMIGYPTEEREDFEETKNLYRRFLPYNKKVIANVAIGPTALILPGAPLARMKDSMGITFDPAGHWVMGENTIERRIEWWIEFRQFLKELGYQVGPDRHSNYIQQEIDTVKKYKPSRRDWDPWKIASQYI